MNLSRIKAMGTGLGQVQRFGRAAVSNLSVRQDMMFVDMSQGNVGKWGQLQAVEIDWQVGGVISASKSGLP